jgi:hypothetical protein
MKILDRLHGRGGAAGAEVRRSVVLRNHFRNSGSGTRTLRSSPAGLSSRHGLFDSDRYERFLFSAYFRSLEKTLAPFQRLVGRLHCCYSWFRLTIFFFSASW